MSWLRPVVLHLSVFAVALGAFFVQGPSFVRHPGERVADPCDSVFCAWVLAWDAHALDTPGADVWDAPIQYPARNVLTFSETFFGALPVAYPVLRLSGNPVLASNLFILTAFLLCTYSVFLVVRRLTGCWFAGLASGLLFSFNPLRWEQLPHMHLLAFFLAPPALLCCHRFLESRRLLPLLGAVLCLVGQFYLAMNLGMLLLTTLLGFVGVHLWRECAGRDRLFFLLQPRVRWGLVAAAGLGIVCLLPLVRPYLATMHDWDFARSESENASFSCEPLGLVTPPASFAGYRPLHDLAGDRVRGHYALGLAPWLLALAGLLAVRRQLPHGDDERARLARRLGWTAVFCVVLMMGPYLVWMNRTRPVPLPYLLVFYGVPGARGMRAPARFVVPLLLCLSILAGFAIAHAVRHWSRWRAGARALAVAALVAWVGWDYRVTDVAGVALPGRDGFPPVYDYLAARPDGGPVLELPPGLFARADDQHFQTAHWRPLVHGYSGSFTPAASETDRRLAGPPTDALLRFVALTPAATVVVHLDQYDGPTAAAWRDAPMDRHGFRRAGEIGGAVVWERDGPPSATSAKLRVVESVVVPKRRLWMRRYELVLRVTPAEARLPWRYLERGLHAVEVTLTDARGVTKTFTKDIETVPYLLAGETKQFTVGWFEGLEGPIRAVRVRGTLLEEFETDLSP